MSKQKDKNSPLIIVFEFWGVIAEKPSVSLSTPKAILLNYMAGNINEDKAMKAFEKVIPNFSSDDFKQKVDKNGWMYIIESQGSANFLINFTDMIGKMKGPLNGAKVGIATNQVLDSSGSLDRMMITNYVSFTTNLSLNKAHEPNPEFLESIEKAVGKGRVILVAADDNRKISSPNIEIVRYHKTPDNSLYMAVLNHLSRKSTSTKTRR